MQAELDSPVGPPRPRRLRRDCGSRSLRQCRTHSTACPRELAEDAAVPTPFCGFRRYRSTCSGWGPMSNHVEQVPMRAGADRDGRGGSDVRRLHVEAPGMAAPESACCRDRPRARLPPCVAPDRVPRVDWPGLVPSSPTISRTCHSYQTRRRANALAAGTRTSPAAFQVTAVGRAAKVKVIVGSAGVHRTGSPAPAHPRPPHPPAVPASLAAAFKATGVESGCARASISTHAADRPRVAVGRPRLFSSWRSSRPGARAGRGTLYETDRSVLCARVMRPARRSLCAPPGFLMRRATSAHRSPT